MKKAEKLKSKNRDNCTMKDQKEPLFLRGSFFMFFHAKEIKIYSSSRKTRERVLNKISNDLKTSNALKVCWRQFLQTPVSNLTIDTNSSIIAM